MLRRALLLAVLGLLVATAAASASTARVAATGGGGVAIVIRAAPGERNDIVATPLPAPSPGGLPGTRLTDTAGIRPAPGSEGCAAVDATTVDCVTRGLLDVHLGDRDDTFDGSAGTSIARARGDSGNDVLIGGPGPDMLLGDVDHQSAQGGADRLVGNGGNDNLYGGAGDDTISGGAGNDVTGGAQGHDVEDGGAGNDGLDNFGVGGTEAAAPAGPDTLRGGAGRDQIHAVTKGDRVAAGGGDDAVVAVKDDGDDNRSRQVVDCGSGRDRVEVGSHDDVAACERIFAQHFCYPGPRCRLDWRIIAAGKVVGQGSTKKMDGTRMLIGIRLKGSARARAQRPRGIVVDVLKRVREKGYDYVDDVARGLRIRL